jgi:hypothetical protein
VRLLITDAHGHALGFTRAGKQRRTPSGMVAISPRGPQLYEFLPGRDRVTITATGSGLTSIELFAPGMTIGTPSVFTFPVSRGQSGTLDITSKSAAGTLRFAGRTYRSAKGIGLRVSGLPHKLPRSAKSYTLRITDQFGQPVPGVLIAATGRGLTTTALSDSNGRGPTKLVRTRGGIRIKLTSPTYRTINITIR